MIEVLIHQLQEALAHQTHQLLPFQIGIASLQGGACPEPSGLEPLFIFVENLTQTVVVLGVGLGVLALSISGIRYIWGGIEAKEVAKERIQRVLIGLVILLSAEFVVDYLLLQLPGCTV